MAPSSGGNFLWMKIINGMSKVGKMGVLKRETAKRILKRTAICKSPFVAQCLKQFLKIPHQDRVIANYALIEDVDPSEVLWDMHGMYITREELSCLNGDRWVNGVRFRLLTFWLLLKKLGRFGRSKIQLWHLHDVVMTSAILAVLNGRTKRRHVPAHSGMRIIFGTKTIEILMMNTIQNMSILCLPRNWCQYCIRYYTPFFCMQWTSLFPV
ncbi:hypothetical protein VitviT2T_003853 [Vitis vinifera]|uniref:Uncharacterized protein n=1 Tax=Vitis vinifera TaxID=29760 RepID=A0ABY9BN74_VITVI|nr:hypothetical protein VitviT2T_003853 [Vitis vinifera]